MHLHMQQELLLVMKRLSKVVPLYKDQNTDTNATQFSMKFVEKAGLIKFDFLGLTTLSIINDSN